MNLFTEQELQELSAEIDQQLSELSQFDEFENETKAGTKKTKTIPKKQRTALEQAVNENADSFMKKFARAAKNDLCKKDGKLYKLWQKYGDLDNKSMVASFGNILAGFGLASVPLQTATIAVSVIVIHIGIKAFCEDCE